MQQLNLPDYSQNLRINRQENLIFDVVRRKFVALTPEEWVRQNIVQHLISLHYPVGLIAVEHPIMVNKLNKRCDVVVFGRHAEPRLIVECKAPHVNITQAVFDQIAVYNLKLNVDYMIVSNGLRHFCCKIDSASGNISFLPDFPKYEAIAGDRPQ